MPEKLAAKLYISHHCVLCKRLEPKARRFFESRGWALSVYKLHGNRAIQVNGTEIHETDIPAVPALQIGGATLIGFGILKALRALEREKLI